jgi:predicted aconitase with swiveling domain
MCRSGDQGKNLERRKTSNFILRGRGLNGGIAKGEALVTKPINFFGSYMQGILSETLSKIEDPRHELYGMSLEERVLVFPFSIGSLAGGVSLLEAIMRGVGPKAIVTVRTDGVLLAAPVFARIFYGIEVPVVDSLEKDPMKVIRNGDFLTVNGFEGTVEVTSIE